MQEGGFHEAGTSELGLGKRVFSVEKRDGGSPGRGKGMGNGITDMMWTKGMTVMGKLQCS